MEDLVVTPICVISMGLVPMIDHIILGSSFNV
jgi:hypothetical protein